MSLLELVRQMADVERGWFRRVIARQDAPPHFRSDTTSTETSTAQCPCERIDGRLGQ